MRWQGGWRSGNPTTDILDSWIYGWQPKTRLRCRSACLPGEMVQTYPIESWPQGKPRTWRRDYNLVWFGRSWCLCYSGRAGWGKGGVGICDG